MKDRMTRIAGKLRKWMEGRYGTDELNSFFCVTAWILLFLSFLPRLRLLNALATALLLWAVIRTLSRNTKARLKERDRYMKVRDRIVTWFRREVIQRVRLLRFMWRDRKTHRYYRCPNCKAVN